MSKPAKETQYVFPYASIEETEELKALEAKLVATPESPEDGKLWFEKYKLMVEQSNMREAINCLSRCIAIDPFCGIYYRWRGHRHLNCGDIEDACADFTMATRLLPENWDAWYHLALCNVVLGRHYAAEYAHKKCWSMHMTDQKRVPVVNWAWINLGLLGRREEADELLKKYIAPDMQVGPNAAYLKMCLAYKGEIPLEELLNGDDDDEDKYLGIATQAFGLANYYRINGDMDKYNETIDFIVEECKSAWNGFGYSAACYVQKKR